MINPVTIIAGAALFLSVFAACVINRPKKPVLTGTVIVILVCFVVFTFMIDNAITALNTNENDAFVGFLTMSDKLTYDGLSASFNTFMCFDIALIAASLITLFVEMVIILRKGPNE